MEQLLNIRNLTAADLEDIDPVLMAAYGRTSSFKSELQLCLTLQPDGWLIAEWDGTPVGMIGAVDYGAFAYVGLLAVHPNFQGRRIGRVLMERILAWLDKHGCHNAVLDASEAGRLLYTKLDFVEEEKSLVLQQETAAQHLCSYKFVSELRSTDLAAVANLDTPLFGADRQAVFTAFLNEFPDRAFVARNQGGQLVGYLFAQPQKLGPWAASTLEVAEALLVTALRLSFNGAPFVLVPDSNRAATALLYCYGFNKQRSLSHMRRGSSLVPSRRDLLYGMASFALG